MNALISRVSAFVWFALLAGTANAVVIETVPVGNPGNAGELSGEGAGGCGPDRICGIVDYAYNIGKYEVTAGQYTAFLNAVAATDPFGLYNTNMWSSQYGCKIQRSSTSGTYTYSIASDCANRPVNYVSWGDAARFANWLHNGQPAGPQNADTTEDGAYDLAATQPYYNPDGTINDQNGLDAALLAVNRNGNWKWAITSEDEWYKAAYYDPTTGSYYDYPTSSNAVPGRDLNDPGNNANYYGTPFPIDSPHYTTGVGQFHNSASPYGTFDQGGNVWEWNEAVIGSHRGVRGGSFGSLGDSLLASGRYDDGDSAAGEYLTLGFRVSEVPEPTSLAILAFGGIGTLVRRRGLGR